MAAHLEYMATLFSPLNDALCMFSNLFLSLFSISAYFALGVLSSATIEPRNLSGVTSTELFNDTMSTTNGVNILFS